MKKNILNKATLLLAVLVIFGCKVRKPAPSVSPNPQQTSNANTIANKAEILKQIAAKQVNFNTLQIKAKADLTIGDKKNDVNMNIRMQKGKTIWISVSVPIIGEIARAFITPDSIKLLNKLENTYIRKPFKYVYQFTSEQVTFTTLENIFIGNAPQGTITPSATVKSNEGEVQVSGNLDDLVFALIFNGNNNLILSNLSDRPASQSLLVGYNEFLSISNQEIPHTVAIKSKASTKNINIDLNYTTVSLNQPVDFPFNVPKRYTVKD